MEFFKKYFQILLNKIKNNKLFKKTTAFFQQKDVVVFLIFLLVSTFIWFSNALRDEYSYEYNFSIKLTNIPDDLILLSSPIQKLNVKVEGTGYSLIRQAISNKISPLNYDVTKLYKSAKSQKSFLLSSDHYDKILNQLLVGVELLKISPDTIFVQIEPKVRKKFAVKLDGELHFAKQYIQSDEIVFEPESIMVSGHKEVIDTMQFVYTTFQRFNEINDTIIKNVSLVKPKSLEFCQEKIKITIPVEVFTEKSITVPIENVEINDSLRLKLFPPDINVTFRTALSKIDKINSNDFDVTIDEEILTNGDRPQRLKVRLDHDNPHIKRINFTPIYVDYLLEKK